LLHACTNKYYENEKKFFYSKIIKGKKKFKMEKKFKFKTIKIFLLLENKGKK
jgi:hypothetical protein